jgi:hypothetical protein
VINSETINALPITRNYGGVLYATPDSSCSRCQRQCTDAQHGAVLGARRHQHGGRVFVDGVSVNGPSARTA